MLAVWGGLGAALAWTATTLLASRAAALIDALSLLAGVMTVGLVVTLPLALTARTPGHLSGSGWVWLAVAGVANVAGLIVAYAALSAGKAGIVGTITSAEGAVAAVIAIAAGERPGAVAGVALAVIVAGVVLAAARNDGAQRRSVALAVCAALCFGWSVYGTGRVGAALGPVWAVVPARAVGVAAVAIPLAIRRRWRLPRAAAYFVLFDGVCEVAGGLSYAAGARHGLAVSAVVASTYAGITPIAAYALLKERFGAVQAAGIALIAGGVLALSAVGA